MAAKERLATGAALGGVVVTSVINRRSVGSCSMAKAIGAGGVVRAEFADTFKADRYSRAARLPCAAIPDNQADLDAGIPDSDHHCVAVR